MIIKITDRYEGTLLHLWKIDITKEQLKEIKEKFKIYLNKALSHDDILDADDEELSNYIESKGYKIEELTIDEEIDL
jgi:hypothetical protein